MSDTTRSLLLSVGMVLLGGCGACSETGVVPGAEAAGAAGLPASGGGSGASGSAGRGGGAGSGGGAGAAGSGGTAPLPCLVEPRRPAHVPEGWHAWTDYDCELPLWVPNTEADLPSPPVWEPCEGAPEGLACRMLQPPPCKGTVSAVVDYLQTLDTPAPLIAHHVECGSRETYSAVSELDGPVRFALRAHVPFAGGLALRLAGLEAGVVGLDLQGGDVPDANDSHKFGLALGKVGELEPRLFAREERDLAPGTWWHVSWDTNSRYAARGEAPSLRVDIFPLDGGPSFLFTSPATDPDGWGGGSNPVMHFDDVFGEVGNLKGHAVIAYDPVRGVHPLIRWPNAPEKWERGAFDFGTDGTDMVWVLGEQHPPGEGVYPVKSLMTASYTTDPAALRPRRLRSDIAYGTSVTPTAVGCGFAARAERKRLLIVRLADGWSWTVEPKGAWWYPSTAIGLTCEEVFFKTGGTRNGQFMYGSGRIQLDSLGPGQAPD